MEYLDNAFDYAQEAFESANELFSKYDPFPNFGFPGAKADFIDGFGNGAFDDHWQDIGSTWNNIKDSYHDSAIGRAHEQIVVDWDAFTTKAGEVIGEVYKNDVGPILSEDSETLTLR